MTYQGEHFLKKLLADVAVQGYEQSVKLSANSIISDRWLFGLNIENINDDKIALIFDRIHMPGNFQDEFFSKLKLANQVLFGYEADPQGPIIKVYLEFWNQVSKAVKLAEPEYLKSGQMPQPNLMHIGYKWHLDSPDKTATTNYLCLPLLNPREISKKISAIYPKDLISPSLTASQAILNIASLNNPAGSFIYLEASEPESPRTSFDLNLYKANTKISKYTKVLDSLTSQYQIQDSSWQAVFEPIQHHTLGHISAGTTRANSDFLTLYFEIQ